MTFTRSGAFGALIFSAFIAAVIAGRPAVSPPAAEPATTAAAGRVDTGHALVASYLQDAKDARLAADREADAQLAMSRQQAAAEAALRMSDARAASGKAVQIAVVTPLPRPSPIAVHLQPQHVAQVAPEAAPQTQKRPVLARVVSTVKGIPGWVSSSVVDAASWVVDLPGQVVRLPERRFL